MINKLRQSTTARTFAIATTTTAMSCVTSETTPSPSKLSMFWHLPWNSTIFSTYIHVTIIASIWTCHRWWGLRGANSSPSLSPFLPVFCTSFIGWRWIFFIIVVVFLIVFRSFNCLGLSPRMNVSLITLWSCEKYTRCVFTSLNKCFWLPLNYFCYWSLNLPEKLESWDLTIEIMLTDQW